MYPIEWADIGTSKCVGWRFVLFHEKCRKYQKKSFLVKWPFEPRLCFFGLWMVFIKVPNVVFVTKVGYVVWQLPCMYRMYMTRLGSGNFPLVGVTSKINTFQEYYPLFQNIFFRLKSALTNIHKTWSIDKQYINYEHLFCCVGQVVPPAQSSYQLRLPI
jgi:hypothetical protein